MATVTVDTSWRVSRVEFHTMHNMPHTVIGYGEVMMNEAGKDVLLGIMPSNTVSRDIDSVLDQAVEVDGVIISFATLSEALKAFLVKWQLEDADKPAADVFVRPQAAEETPVKMPELTAPKT